MIETMNIEELVTSLNNATTALAEGVRKIDVLEAKLQEIQRQRKATEALKETLAELQQVLAGLEDDSTTAEVALVNELTMLRVQMSALHGQIEQFQGQINTLQ